MAPDRRMVEAAQWAADQFAAGQPGNRAIRNAILAWWAAEDGWDWPTNSRNNPGNLRPGGDETGSVGISGPPIKGFYIYATPGDGVAMFVQRIKRSAHYPGIRSAIAKVAAGAAGPSVICRAVGSSPWGTNTVTMLATLAVASRVGATPHGTGWATVHTLGPGAGGGKAPAPSSAGAGITLIDYNGPAAKCANVAPVPPQSGIAPFLPGSGSAYPIPKGRLGDECACAPGYNRAVVDPQVNGLFGTNYVPIDQLQPGQANACVKVGYTEGSVAGQAVTEGIAAAIAGLGDAAVHVAWLLAILGLILIGVYLLATSD